MTLFRSDLGYSAVNTARSALSSIVTLNDGSKFAARKKLCNNRTSLNHELFIYQLTTNFWAKYQLTTIFWDNCQLTVNLISTLLVG